MDLNPDFLTIDKNGRVPFSDLTGIEESEAVDTIIAAQRKSADLPKVPVPENRGEADRRDAARRILDTTRQSTEARSSNNNRRTTARGRSEPWTAT